MSRRLHVAGRDLGHRAQRSEATHREANDYTPVVPAELLAVQKRGHRVFDIVMVALTSISPLVGGIGIMNTCWRALKRMRKIGVRRTVGACYTDIAR